MLNKSERYRQKQHYYFDLLDRAIGKHKVKIWSGMFLSVTIIGALALVGLLNPGFEPTDLQHNSSSTSLDPRSSTSIPQPSGIVVQPQNRATSAKWLLVLLASTTGGWFITYKLKHAGKAPKSTRQRVKHKVRSKPNSHTAVPSRQKNRHSQLLEPPQTSAPVLRNPFAERARSPVPPPQVHRAQLNTRSHQQRSLALQPAPPSLVPARLQTQHSVPVSFPNPVFAEEPQVSLVPAETVMPLDRREPGLAEMLDLRKRHTITSIMGGMTDVE